MKKRITLIAEDGKWLTDGEKYLREVILTVGENGELWHEITDAEYEKIIAANQRDEILI